MPEKVDQKHGQGDGGQKEEKRSLLVATVSCFREVPNMFPIVSLSKPTDTTPPRVSPSPGPSKPYLRPHGMSSSRKTLTSSRCASALGAHHHRGRRRCSFPDWSRAAVPSCSARQCALQTVLPLPVLGEGSRLPSTAGVPVTAVSTFPTAASDQTLVFPREYVTICVDGPVLIPVSRPKQNFTFLLFHLLCEPS